MVWTRAVLIMSALGIVVVAASQRNRTLHHRVRPELLAQTRLRRRVQPLRALTARPMVTMSAAIHASLVMRIKAAASTRPRWEKRWHVRTLPTRLTVVNRVTVLAVHTSRRVVPRIRFRFASLKIPKTQWPRKTSPARNATPAKTSCSGWEAPTNRGPLPASTATKRIRSVIPPCPMSHASTRRLRKTRSLKETQPELCLRCHQMRRAQLQRSSHMPYREGKVTCTSCHNPHGTPNPTPASAGHSE